MRSNPIDAAAWAGDRAPAGDFVPDARDIRPRRLIKRVLPQSMFGRSLLLIVAPLVLLQVIATWIFYDRHWEAVSYRFSADVAGDVAMVINTLNLAGSPAERGRFLAEVASVTETRYALRRGSALPAGEPPSGSILDTQLRRAMISRVGRPFSIDTRSRPGRVLIDVALTDAVLAVDLPFSRLYTPTTYIFILWMVGSSLVLLGVSALFLRNQVRSLRRLAAAAEHFGKGRPVAFSKIEGALEVRQAAAAFLRMRDRIQRQINQRTSMLAGISHDLRTPLTRMKLALELLGGDPVAPGLKADVAEMERLVDLYLDFARGEGAETPVETDLSPLIDDVAAAARRDGTPLAVSQPTRLMLPVRPQALRRCLGNLLANARRYGRHVWLASVPVEDGVDIVIDDDGPGIPPAERDRVFQPFVRLDSSRNPSTGGIGLGLTIARDVARSHGGDVRLETSPHGGLRARVHLPR